MKTTGKFAIALACLSAPIVASAQDIGPLDTFSARIGGYISSFDTQVRADGTTERGTEIDLNRDLGLDDSGTLAYIAVTWRPWEHHEFGIAYYQDDAENTRQVTRDFTFQDTTYRTNSVISTEVDIGAYEAYYTWWAAVHETWALGPRIGLVWYTVDMQISQLVDVNGNVIGNGRFEEASADLPSPSIGGSWRWAPGNGWRLSADAGYFSANVNDVDGNVAFGRFGVEWFPWETSGFSLDYTISKINVDADTSRFMGHLDFIDSGLRLGYVYRW
jgi:hypothetical protein